MKKRIAIISALLIGVGGCLCGNTAWASEVSGNAPPQTEEEIPEAERPDGEEIPEGTVASVSGESPAEDAGTVKEIDLTEHTAVNATVPLYNYDIVNVTVPAKFAVALNPYGLSIRTGKDTVSTEQVVSWNYGIINKSTTDKVVTVKLEVEDLNGGQITFVDSAEEAEAAGEDEFALYLAAVPADGGEILLGGEPAEADTSGNALMDVSMTGAYDQAVALHAGQNQISFRLEKAAYNFGGGGELSLEADAAEEEEDIPMMPELVSLAPGNGGVTAFTFTGVMNPKADWSKLIDGIRISAVYSYETADGNEVLVEGTGAMVQAEP